ncbi:HK97 gp10 family phage protein [Neisseria sicca]|uniref:HK97 gp10 family phage protein n=1 Tax=Neisseria sicca TaxID=490 RepID=UPI000D2FABC3|nr:HK97 gp10 family phage protein [Neisseria sicca]
MLKMEFIGGDVLAAVLRSYGDKVQTAIVQSIGRSALKLQSEVMQNRLSGQVLNVRTGNLRRSIHQRVTNTGSAVIGEVNTNVRYGKAHEYGFAGTVNVKASLRQARQAFGRPLKSPRYVQVRAHSRNVRLPERSFLRTALRDMKTEIEADLRNSVKGALR